MSAKDLEPVPVEGCRICAGYVRLRTYCQTWRGLRGDGRRQAERANDEIRNHPHKPAMEEAE
ncbi:hypothetical protein ACWF94_26550 [Streptomyces sp. NPDC055078]